MPFIVSNKGKKMYQTNKKYSGFNTTNENNTKIWKKQFKKIIQKIGTTNNYEECKDNYALQDWENVTKNRKIYSRCNYTNYNVT